MKCIKAVILSAILIIATAFNAFAGGDVSGNTITYSISGKPSVRGTSYYVYLLTDGATIKCYRNMSTQAPTAMYGGTTNKKYLSMPIVSGQTKTNTGLADSVRFTYSIDRSGIFNGTVTIVNPNVKVTGVAFVVRDSANHYYSINDTQNISSYVYDALHPEVESETETETEKETESETESKREKETISQKEIGKIKDSISDVTKGKNKGTQEYVPECVLKRLLGQISS